MPLVAGRQLTESNGPAAAGALLVNQALARRLWPGGSPLGARVDLPKLGFAGEVVGVVADVPPLEAGTPPEAEVYIPNRQRTRWGTMFVLRIDGDQELLRQPVTSAVARVDAELSPSRLRTLDEAFAGELRRPRFHFALVGALAFVALVLGAAVVYGVMSYAVSRQSRAIAIRIALGARRSRVLRDLIGDGLRLVAVGAAIGVGGALAAARFARWAAPRCDAARSAGHRHRGARAGGLRWAGLPGAGAPRQPCVAGAGTPR